MEDLARVSTKPHLFHSTGAKILDNELIPSNARIEFNVIVPVPTTTQGGSTAYSGGQQMHMGHSHHGHHSGGHRGHMGGHGHGGMDRGR